MGLRGHAARSRARWAPACLHHGVLGGGVPRLGTLVGVASSRVAPKSGVLRFEMRAHPLDLCLSVWPLIHDVWLRYPDVRKKNVYLGDIK